MIHIDGTAGAGKTELTRLLEEMFKTQKKGTKVSQVYSAIFQDHIDRNMKPRLGDGYKYINVGEVLAKLWEIIINIVMLINYIKTKSWRTYWRSLGGYR